MGNDYLRDSAAILTLLAASCAAAPPPPQTPEPPEPDPSYTVQIDDFIFDHPRPIIATCEGLIVPQQRGGLTCIAPAPRTRPPIIQELFESVPLETLYLLQAGDTQIWLDFYDSDHNQQNDNVFVSFYSACDQYQDIQFSFLDQGIDGEIDAFRFPPASVQMASEDPARVRTLSRLYASLLVAVEYLVTHEDIPGPLSTDIDARVRHFMP